MHILIMSLARLAISLLVGGLLLPLAYIKTVSGLKKIIIFGTGIVILTIILTIYPYNDGDFNKLINQTSQGEIYLYWALALCGYIVSWILLFPKDIIYTKLSFYIFTAAYANMWTGLLTKEWEFPFQSISPFGQFAILMIIIALPLFNMLYYFPIIFDSKKFDIRDFADKETFHIKAVSNIFGKLVIFALILGILAGGYKGFIIDKESMSFLIVYIVLLGGICKMLISILIYRIDFDFKNHKIGFYRTFGKSVIKDVDIKNWGIAEYRPSHTNPRSQYGLVRSFVEIELKNGKKTSYPLFSWQLGNDELPVFRTAFEKVIGTQPIALEISINSTFSKSSLWFFTI